MHAFIACGSQFFIGTIALAYREYQPELETVI